MVENIPKIEYEIRAIYDEYAKPLIEKYESLEKAQERIKDLSSISDFEGPITLEKITREVVLQVKN